MPLLAAKKQILAKIETTYGVDSTPDGTSNAIQTSNLTLTPMAGSTVSRDLDKATLGNDLQIQVGTYVQVTFSVEVAGGGAATTPPSYGPLLEACGFDETVSSNVVYAPTSTAFDSMTMVYQHDGQHHKITGARGSVALSLDPGTIPQFNFTFMGLYNAPSTETDATPDYTGFQVALPSNNTNTTAFSLHGSTSTLSALSLDMANQIVYRNVVGDESVPLVDRAPSGSCTIETPAITDQDWFAIAIASTTGPLVYTHGISAGNIVTIGAPNCQIVSPNYGESDGISTLQLGLSLVPGSAGDDELTITTS